MRYIGNIYRPPTESNSLLIQVTIGCSHNQCTFCDFYSNKRFRIRKFEEIEEDLWAARKEYKTVPSVFLIDGNVTCLSMNRLRPILLKIREIFPESKHTNMYGSYNDINRKSLEDLKELKELGVETIVIGFESGSDIVLADIKKGFTFDVAKSAGQKLAKAGIGSVGSILLGIGGVKNSAEHVKGSIALLNELDITLLGLTIFNPQPGTEIYHDIINDRFELPTYRQIFEEEEAILQGLDPNLNCTIYSGVYVPNNHIIVGTFPQDRERMIRESHNRPITEAHLLDKEIQIGGHL